MDTEAKIKEAARKVFKEKGYAGTRTRDIAEEAGVNPALLNYYFRSKDGLFKEVMKDILVDFIGMARPTLLDKSKSFKEGVVELINRVTDLYLEEPDMVIFIINELRSMPKEFLTEVHFEEMVKDTVLYQFFSEHFGPDEASLRRGLMFIISAISYILFPFVCKPVLGHLAGVDDKGFREMMDERRKVFPAWLDFMMEQYL